jgi:hypothetical protein
VLENLELFGRKLGSIQAKLIVSFFCSSLGFFEKKKKISFLNLFEDFHFTFFFHYLLGSD